MTKQILTIAGSDAGGGAGIQADLKTFEEFNTFGISTITSILSVNPQTEQHALYQIPLEVIDDQLTTAFSGGSLTAVKIGLLGATSTIPLIAERLNMSSPEFLVVDPVAAVKSTTSLLQNNLLNEIISKLFPIATVVTPNLIEAEILSGLTIRSLNDMKQAAIKIKQLGPKSVVIKGGARLAGAEAIDLVYDGESFTQLTEPMLPYQTNHGAGCSFSAAITANLANGHDLLTSVEISKKYVHEAIKHGIYLNEKTGYVWHGAYRQAQLGGIYEPKVF